MSDMEATVERISRQLIDRAEMYNLAVRVLQKLGDRNLTLATAESETGGLIAHTITEVPGSSRSFLGGIVSYANEAKRDLLGVAESTLAEHGAVSEPTARAMVTGALQRFGADVAVAVTGIAGPGGGSAEKPVGLSYIAVGDRSGRVIVRREVFPGDRSENKRRAAFTGLSMVEELLG